MLYPDCASLTNLSFALGIVSSFSLKITLATSTLFPIPLTSLFHSLEWDVPPHVFLDHTLPQFEGFLENSELAQPRDGPLPLSLTSILPLHGLLFQHHRPLPVPLSPLLFCPYGKPYVFMSWPPQGLKCGFFLKNFSNQIGMIPYFSLQSLYLLISL